MPHHDDTPSIHVALASWRSFAWRRCSGNLGTRNNGNRPPPFEVCGASSPHKALDGSNFTTTSIPSSLSHKTPQSHLQHIASFRMSDFIPPTGPPPPKVPEGWKVQWNDQYSEWYVHPSTWRVTVAFPSHFPHVRSNTQLTTQSAGST